MGMSVHVFEKFTHYLRSEDDLECGTSHLLLVEENFDLESLELRVTK